MAVLERHPLGVVGEVHRLPGHHREHPKEDPWERLRARRDTMPTDPSIELIADVASLDPLIRQRVLALADMALSEAEFTIRHGDPSMKASLIRTFMAAMAKHLQSKDANQEIEELRAQLEALKDAVMGRVPGTHPNSTIQDEDIVEPGVDTPVVPLDRRAESLRRIQ